MQSEQMIERMPNAFQKYIAHGWRLCMVDGEKRPVGRDWNSSERALGINATVPSDYGAGLMHAYSGTCALDVDNFPLAEQWLAERGVNLKELFLAPDSVQISSGVAHHGKLLFALPSFMAMPSKKITVDGKTALEFRCGSANSRSVQDVLPPSPHPSGTVYRWAGNGHWENPPQLPAQLLTIWQQLTTVDKERKHSTGAESTPASWSEIVTALYAIDPDCSRQCWIEVGMAVQSTEDSSGFDLWNEWSSAGAKYNSREMRSQWKSFKPKENGITLGTLFHHAQSYGWKRPTPNVSELPWQIEQPQQIEQVKLEVSLTAPVPRCDPSHWPEPLRTRALEVASEVGCDPIVPLIAGLCAVSCVADKRISLTLSSTWNVPPILWAMTIGEPSDKKTPGSKPMFAPIRKLEREDGLGHQAKMLEWQGKEARHAAQMKAYREFEASPEAELGNQNAPHVEPLGPPPADLRLLITDATTQKVVSMAEHRPAGFLLWLDEMNRWFTNLSNPRTTDDRGCWMQGYESGQYNFDRIGAGSIKVENLAVSIYGNCQPEVYRSHIASLSVDGILQRFLPVTIDPKYNRLWQDALPEFMSHSSVYEQLIRRTFNLPVQRYTLDHTANLLFRLFCQQTLKLRNEERLLKSSIHYQNALGKLEGNCARLILLLHLIISPYDLIIPESTVAMAKQLMDKFFIPSLNHAFLEVGQQQSKAAMMMLDYLIVVASARPTVNMAEMRKVISVTMESRSSRERDEEIVVSMADFALRGFVSMFQDHPRHPVWAVNPELAVIYKDYREQLIRSKQERIEQTRANIEANIGKPAKGLGDAIGWKELQENAGN